MVAALATPALAQSADPLGLITEAETMRIYTTGPDTFEVIVCDVPDGEVAVTPEKAVGLFTAILVPYYRTMSGGRYEPAFFAGQTVVSGTPSGWPDDPFTRQLECESRASAAVTGSPDGIIVVVDAAYGGGYASPGCAPACTTSAPGNRRLIVVGAATVVAVPNGPSPVPVTVAHEIGHTISWPHSFGGANELIPGVTDEYDNPMDVMSAGDLESVSVGTIAINRYAAGWLRPDMARFHRGGTIRYTLDPDGVSGAAFLILPSETPGYFEILAPRVRSKIDTGIPAEGIEAYRIDQTSAACGQSSGCSGLYRRTSQIPASVGRGSTAHVYPVGAFITVRGVTIQVESRVGDTFTLAVSGASVSDRFLDDTGNPHASSILFIADRGISLGCNPPLVTLFCPTVPVTRAEMAAFILRAIGDVGVPTSSQRFFSDVPAGAWYTDFVNRLAELGITSGYSDGTFKPNATVTRGEMAVFLGRAFDRVNPVGTVAGVFSDVPTTAFFAASAEGLLAAGVTTGCATDPLRFCPSSPVLRDQMATFLTRSLSG